MWSEGLIKLRSAVLLRHISDIQLQYRIKRDFVLFNMFVFGNRVPTLFLFNGGFV